MGFWNLFSSSKFPQEGTEGEIYIKGDVLFYTDHGYVEEVDLTQLRYAYAEVLAERPYLFLFDFQQRYISAELKGFEGVYKQLSERFGFNDSLFLEVINSKKEQKQRIWLKKEPRNYEVLEAEFEDFDEGFEVLKDEGIFVSWDTQYDEIEDLKVGHFYQGTFDMRYFKFDYPVRIGKLKLDGLEFYADDERQDIAIQSYFVTLYDESNSDKSYRELRALWKEETDVSEEDLVESGFEREDQCYLGFNLDGVQITLCYTYDSEHGYDDGGTSVGISNYRAYEDATSNEDYDGSIELTHVIDLEDVYEVEADYRKNNFVKDVPTVIGENYENSSVIWLDKKNGILGFSGEEYALIYPFLEVDYLVIQNILPAKGGGYSELRMVLKNGDSNLIYYGNQNEFDDYAETLLSVFDLKVEFPEPYYNC